MYIKEIQEPIKYCIPNDIIVNLSLKLTAFISKKPPFYTINVPVLFRLTWLNEKATRSNEKVTGSNEKVTRYNEIISLSFRIKKGERVL